MSSKKFINFGAKDNLDINAVVASFCDTILGPANSIRDLARRFEEVQDPLSGKPMQERKANAETGVAISVAGKVMGKASVRKVLEKADNLAGKALSNVTKPISEDIHGLAKKIESLEVISG